MTEQEEARANDLIQAFKNQRNAAMDEAALLYADAMAARRELEAIKAKDGAEQIEGLKAELPLASK
jgi:hypothetical protein